MDRKAYLIQARFDGHEDHERSVIAALNAAGYDVQPYNAAPGIPAFPTPTTPTTPTVATPPLPWRDANVQPAGTGNGFKVWDRDLRLSWLYNDDPRPLSNGKPGTRVWKARLYGNHWVSIDERATLLGAKADSMPKRTKR